MDEDLKGRKAFLPIMHPEGDGEVPVVAEVEYGNENYRPLPGKRFANFDEADLEAFRMNEQAGIPHDVWWRIGESIKNADI